jgi:hypothetical protein
VRNRGLVLLSALVCVAAQACGPDSARVCTLIGGENGIHLSIPEALFVRSGDVVFKVCDGDTCASTTRRLAELPKDVPTPVGRGSAASFSALGRKFSPGAVKVTVQLRGPRGNLVASRTQMVMLGRYYPNGKDCDGDGYVGGGLGLISNDRV